MKISLSIFKFLYLFRFSTDLSSRGLKIQVEVVSIEVKRKFEDGIKAFCFLVNQTFLYSWDTWQTGWVIHYAGRVILTIFHLPSGMLSLGCCD